MNMLGTILQEMTSGAAPSGPVQASGLQGAGGLGAMEGLSGALVPVLTTLLSGSQQGSGSPIASLLGRFEQAGLGQVAQSWVGTGPNQPVSPQQVQTALGDDQVQAMSSQTGMAPQNLVSEIARVLPGLIDRLTPEGKLPVSRDMAPGFEQRQ